MTARTGETFSALVETLRTLGLMHPGSYLQHTGGGCHYRVLLDNVPTNQLGAFTEYIIERSEFAEFSPVRGDDGMCCRKITYSYNVILKPNSKSAQIELHIGTDIPVPLQHCATHLGVVHLNELEDSIAYINAVTSK